ncbi:uncharacterized protein [Dysidea avara]|uniref:uncharacterized protein isoform X2 n=1 Tax=Dysidea avara TaxID=196820 RepID=UPI0033268B3D
MSSVRRSRRSSTFEFNFEIRDIIIVPFEGGLWIAQRVVSFSVKSHDEEEVEERIENRPARADGYSPIGRSIPHRKSKCEILCEYFTGLLLDCPTEDNINTYAVVQGILNLGFVVLFGVTTVLDKWFYEFYESKLPYISVFFDLALVFSIAWMVLGSVWIWGSLLGWDDDHSQCNNALFIGATTYLCFHYLSFMIICCNCFKCRISNWCSKLGKLYKD